MQAIRLLLVDDSEVYRSAMELVLGREPSFDVVASVGDGDEALQACAERDVDVALLDYRLPDTDGTRLTAALRAAHPDLAIVCLTAEAAPAERAAVLAAGAAAVVEKGDLDELVAAIGRVAPPP